MVVLNVLCDLSGGGAERMVLHLCRFAHHPVRVVTIQGGGELSGDFAYAGVSVRCARRIRRHPGGRALMRLARWSAEADLIHTHLWDGDFFGRIAGALVGRPVVTTEHNTRPDSSLRGVVTAAMAPLSEAVVFVSEAAARAAVMPARRKRVIENGIDLTRFQPGPLRSGPMRRLLAVGRLAPQKGFDVLLRALHGVPDLSLTILGEGEQRPLLQALADPLGDRVRMPGWVADIRPFLADADLVVIPSRWEGFGLIAVEAMASGRPVLASGVDGLVEVIGDAGMLVPPSDPGALAAALLDLKQDRPAREEMRRRGLAQAERFDIRRTADRYAALYRSILS
ncbi:MAG: glycosyltransferase [Myxococcota bacterium]